MLPLCANQERTLLARAVAKRYFVEYPPGLMRFGLRFVGPLDVEALRRALNLLIRRQTALRVIFRSNPEISWRECEYRLALFRRTAIFEPGLYVQTLVEDAEIELLLLDLSKHDDKQQQAALTQKLIEEASLPFDYTKAPLIRGYLVKCGDLDHLLLIVIDHIVSDGWSLALMKEEIRTLYLQETGETPRRLVLPAMSFPDFAAWQHRAYGSSYFDRSVIYWREQWVKFGPRRISFSDLPFTLPSPAHPDFAFALAIGHLSENESEAVRLLARQTRTTLFSVFLAAVAVTLSTVVEKTTVAIWCHMGNRVRPETRRTVGCFTNTHLIGIDLESGLSGWELLRRVRAVLAWIPTAAEAPNNLWRYAAAMWLGVR
jgi:hypothetical protein